MEITLKNSYQTPAQRIVSLRFEHSFLQGSTTDDPANGYDPWNDLGEI